MLDALIDLFGDSWTLALGGAAIGLLFGALAQRSRFCLHAATREVACGRPGERLAIWLFAVSAALLATQALILGRLFDTGAVRQLASVGSLSGAIVGGLMFGAGMALARASASRMVVLSATGNARMAASWVVFAVAAQATRDGALSPLRAAVAGLWTVEGPSRDLLATVGAGHVGAAAFAGLWLAGGVAIAVAHRVPPGRIAAAVGLGLTIALAWWFNHAMAATSFEMVPVHALSFTAPSADVLAAVLAPPVAHVSFDLGLIPGVVLGAVAAAAVGGGANGDPPGHQGDDGASLPRSMIGGLLLGVGGVLAGGCEVGAGLSGTSVFASTAWAALASMGVGAVVTDRLIGHASSSTAAPER